MTVLQPRPLAVASAPPRALTLPSIDPWRLLRPAPVVLLFAAYLAVGLAFSLGAGIVTGDAWSRVGNAYYVLFSRDPHLAAIGFVWNPLPSLLELPILPFVGLWRPLVDHGVAGSLMSAACMALAVRELWLWLRDLGPSRPVRIGLTAAFAAHPLILLYGGNGMSEAPFLLFLIVAGRAFSDWVASGSVGRLAVTGLALALAYLTRYEAVAPMIAIGLLTLMVSYHRARGTRQQRVIEAAADGLIVGMPPIGAFVAWALASWLIVGSPFATFTSIYGNTSQVALSLAAIRSSTGDTPVAAAIYVGQQIGGLEPFLALIGVVAVLISLLRRDMRVLVPLAVFGSVLAFSTLLFVGGSSFGWLRFSITAIPLAATVVALVLSPNRSVARWSSGTPRLAAIARLVPVARLAPVFRVPASVARRAASAPRILVSVALVALVLGGLPSAANVVFDGRLAREESPQLRGLVGGDRAMPAERNEFLASGAVARYLDARNLPRGSVVVDVALGFWVVLQSAHPEQFVITPDRDFDKIVEDPAIFNVPYVLVSPPTGVAALNALERSHHGMFADGGGIATLVQEFDDAGGRPAWRLYRVDE